MSRSQKFPVAIHVLVAMAKFRDRHLSSEMLSGTVNTNPVVVRRILQALKQAGLVESMPGSQGGSTLARSAVDITLLDVYDAVDQRDSCEVHEGSQQCFIAKTVCRVVPEILDEADAARRNALKGHTIAGLVALAEVARKEAAA